jgi:iron uptake system component EfeO
VEEPVLRPRRLAVALLPVALVIGACGGDDDGASVRDCGGASASGGSASGGSASGGSASGGSASGGGSCTTEGTGDAGGTGIGDDVAGSTTDNPLVEDALAEYTTYVQDQVDETITATTTLTDAVRAGDLEGAKAAFAPSRQGWERIEPIAGLVEELDGAMDARVDDFVDENDPAFTGWHRIEYILWEEGETESAVEFADKLDDDLQTLKTELASLEIPPAALAVGSSELIDEVANGKITGEEDRYSHTDLWDFAANVEGSKKGFELLTPAIEEEDPELVETIDGLYTELEGQLSAYEDGNGGYVSYTELTDADKTEMQTTLAALSENLATVAGVLGLE